MKNGQIPESHCLSPERAETMAVGDIVYRRPEDGIIVCPISALRP